MSANPAFASVPKAKAISVSTANTNRDGSGTLVDSISAAAAGTLLQRVVLQATGDPADSIVTMFLHDGTTSWEFDEFDLGNPAAASATVPGFHTERVYDIVIPTGWKVQFAITAALTAGVVNVLVFAGDLT